MHDKNQNGRGKERMLEYVSVGTCWYYLGTKCFIERLSVDLPRERYSRSEYQ